MTAKQKCPRCGEYRNKLKYIGHQYPSCNECFKKWYRRERKLERKLVIQQSEGPLGALRAAARKRLAGVE